jgi:hypothetical protein
VGALGGSGVALRLGAQFFDQVLLLFELMVVALDAIRLRMAGCNEPRQDSSWSRTTMPGPTT